MRKILVALAVLTTLSLADGNFGILPISTSNAYAGIGYGLVPEDVLNGYGSAETSDSSEANNIFIQAGYNFNKNVAVEARYALGFKDGVNDTSFDTIAVYVKPQINVTSELAVYGLLGYAWSIAYSDNVTNVDFDGLAYGVGAKVAVAPEVEVFVDYTNVYSDLITLGGYDLDTDLYSVNLGVSYKF